MTRSLSPLTALTPAALVMAACGETALPTAVDPVGAPAMDLTASATSELLFSE